jgi:hypothetical protein
MNKYLIHIHLQPRSSEDIKQFGIALTQVLQQQAEAVQFAYSTPDKFQLGYFVQSSKPAGAIRTAIDGNQSVTIDPRNPRRPINTGFRNGDSLFVIELGKDISENGFNVLKTWVNRH